MKIAKMVALAAVLLFASTPSAQEVGTFPPGGGGGGGGGVTYPLLAPNGLSYSFENFPTLGMSSGVTGTVQIRGANASGTDQDSTGLVSLRGARGTGTGTGGDVSILVSPPALVSGSTSPATQNAFYAFNAGHINIGGINSPTATVSQWSGNDVVAGVTDGNGGQVTIRGGVGTGAGTPGIIALSTAPTEASGSTQQTPAARAYITQDGLQMAAVLFANLNGSATNGTISYCSDCTKATPCAGSGNGALAKRLNGAWDCD